MADLSSAPAPRATRPDFLHRLMHNGSFVGGAAVLLLIAGAAILAPVIAPHDPFEMLDMPALMPGENPDMLLGSDSLGRDVLSSLIWGARVSLMVGIVSASISLLLGVVIGAIAGYAGGLTDKMLTKLTEIFQTVPSFLLVIVILTIASPSAEMIALSTGLASWPIVARLVRAQFLYLRDAEFVLAARNLGYSPSRIAFSEILPNALAPIIVTVSVLVANAIIIESGVSFLGLGDPSRISWGSMIGDGRTMIRTAWHLTAIPGLAICITVMALNIMGDGLNDLLNPRS